MDKPESALTHRSRKKTDPGTPALIQTLQTQIEEYDKELRYLERIEATHVKIRYNFGKSPHLLPKDKREIIDLGEFPMEMEKPKNIHTKK